MVGTYRRERVVPRVRIVAMMTAPLLLSPLGALAHGGTLAAHDTSAAHAMSAVRAAATGATSFNVNIGGAGSFAASLPPSSVATFVLPQGGQTVQEWRTTPNGKVLGDEVTPQPGIPLGTSAAGVTITVNPGDSRQVMTGFGAAMTDSAASLINTSQSRDVIMNDLFGASGARFTMVRVPMGATDLISSYYESYDDTPGDVNVTRFSVAHDTKNIIPLLRQARQMQPGLRILATPWSAPRWMKQSGTFDGTCAGALSNVLNTLKPAYYGVYARYFVKFVQAYQGYGLPVGLVSMQNEPENCNSTYPTMNMTEPDEATFAADLRDALNKAHLTTGILGFDHNWYYEPSPGTSVPDPYPGELVGAAGSDLAAIGYHCYDRGNPADPNAFTHQVPYTQHLAVLMTECSGFQSSPDTAGNLVDEIHYDLIGPIRNSASSSLYWSLAMNSSGGPHIGGCTDCRGMVTINSTASGDYTLSQDYFYWEQFSKFVDPGAVVIGSTYQAGPIETVAFRNPDHSIVVVALNTSKPSYVGHIVQWGGDTKKQKTAWLVGPDGHRRWISDIATYNCLKANGASGPDVLNASELDALPDLTGVWAVCGVDRVGVNSMLQTGFYARSQNGTYTLRLTGSNLTLSDTAGTVFWSTGHGGDDLIFQSDGNLVEYSGGRAVWASNTVGSGAAWLVVNNDGTLDLYNGAGSKVWSSAGSPASYTGHIVEWVNGGGQPNTSWIVSSDGKRYWIPDTSTYWCMVNIGFSDLGPQPPGVLDELPDSGQWAHCPVKPRGAQDTLWAGQGLYQGQTITSQNGKYTLILQQDHNLVLYGPSGALWATNTWTGGFVIMQGDGNFVGYDMWDTPKWSTGTGGDGGNCAMVVQNDANLVLYCSGVAKWDRYHGRL